MIEIQLRAKLEAGEEPDIQYDYVDCDECADTTKLADDLANLIKKHLKGVMREVINGTEEGDS